MNLTVGDGGYILFTHFVMAYDTTPATKGDLEILKKEILDQFGEHHRHLEAKIKNLHEDIDRVLTVLVNVEKRLSRSLDDHEERIERLERHLGLTTV